MKKIILASIILCVSAEGMHRTPWNISRRVGRLSVVPVGQESYETPPQKSDASQLEEDSLSLQDPLLKKAQEICRKTSELTKQMYQMAETLKESAKYFEERVNKLIQLEVRGSNASDSKERNNRLSSRIPAAKKANKVDDDIVFPNDTMRLHGHQAEKLAAIESPERTAAAKAKERMKLLTRKQLEDLSVLSDGDDDYTPESDEELNFEKKRPHQSPSKKSPHKKAIAANKDKSPTKKQVLLSRDDGEESLTEPEDDTPNPRPRKKQRKE